MDRLHTGTYSSHMRTMQHSLKQPDISDKTMLKKRIATALNKQNNHLVIILLKTNDNVQNYNINAPPYVIHVTNANNLF